MLDELIKRYPMLSVCMADIHKAEEMMFNTYMNEGKILVCGNGGSCADSNHIVGELMKGFLKKRRMSDEMADKFRKALGNEADRYINNLQGAIPAISLSEQSALLTAYINDVDDELIYAQMVYAYAKKEDMLIAISTSGNSKNVVCAAKVAKVLEIPVLSLTGQNESSLSALSDCTIMVPQTETFKVQELHLPVYHYLCASLEKRLFD